jgi:hypothetical protein
MSDSPQGPYTLWVNHGDGWSFEDFRTLKEAMMATRYTSMWTVQKPVAWSAVDAEDAA